MTVGNMSREEAKKETRGALLKAGYELFVEHGVDHPSLDAICARAGYTRGAFYVHFKDRDDFVFACINKLLDDFVRGVIANTDGASDLRQTVDKFLDAAIHGALPLSRAASTGSMVHFLVTTVQRSPEIRKRYAAMLEQSLWGVGAAIERGQQSGTVRNDTEARHAALIIVACSLGLGTMLDVGVDVDLEGIRTVTHQLMAPPDE